MSEGKAEVRLFSQDEMGAGGPEWKAQGEMVPGAAHKGTVKVNWYLSKATWISQHSRNQTQVNQMSVGDYILYQNASHTRS